ncbi:hypothetical protein Syun_027299 [Stephania yunnanensis]|uniref:Uncharacterized protein n=1 Tax=Stephania yunnanensis TaxID=152371 RepID=A0AAP0EKU9_9MAGN
MATMRPCISSSSRRVFMGSSSILGCESKENSWAKLTSSANIASVQPFFRSFSSTLPAFDKVMPKAMAELSDKSSGHGLPIDLREGNLGATGSKTSPTFRHATTKIHITLSACNDRRSMSQLVESLKHDLRDKCDKVVH